jgi:hypothetical protein
MILLLKIILVIVVTILAILLIRTSQIRWTSDQTDFARGTATELPDGLYAGSAAGPPVSWKGKKFGKANQVGINEFITPDGTLEEKYPFVTSVGPGAHDSIPVIRIDYNLSANPLWLRPVLDEIVEVAPGEYLGKLQLRIIPGYPFTLTFFRLKEAA